MSEIARTCELDLSCRNVFGAGMNSCSRVQFDVSRGDLGVVGGGQEENSGGQHIFG